MTISHHWLEEASLDTTLDILVTLARVHCSRSGPYYPALVKMLDEKDWRGLVSYEPDYELGNAYEILNMRQVLGFFSKLEPLGDVLDEAEGSSREERAFEKFLLSEKLCAETNQYFRTYATGEMNFSPGLRSAFCRAREKMHDVLGKCPSFSDLEPRLGPGATTSIRRKNAVPSVKLAPPYVCSPNTVPYLGSIFMCNPAMLDMHEEKFVIEEFDSHVEICKMVSFDCEVADGVLEFVAKDALSYRSIVKEPTLTSFYQLAIHRELDKRLKRKGIDIHDQTFNQRQARQGSIDGSIATIDLSMASDLVAYELVKWLLPDDWFSLLCGFRSPCVTYDGKVIRLEKFSSMGNGFTFALETLVFYCLMYAVARRKDSLNAYGDDLTCAVEDYDEVIKILRAAGFLPNAKKSFASGPFRESCGADYYRGINVRPYRQKGLISNQTLFILHNRYYRDYEFELADLILSFIPVEVRIFGPDGYGDGHLLRGNLSLEQKGRDKGYSGWVFETYTKEPKRSVRSLPGDFVALLYTIYVMEKTPLMEKTSSTRGGRLVKTYSADSLKYRRTKVYTLSPT